MSSVSLFTVLLLQACSVTVDSMNKLNLLTILLLTVLSSGCVTTPPVASAPSQAKPIARMLSSAVTYPKHIALLLPMQGPYASTSQAIQAGFLAADAQAKQEGSQALSIKVYDTSGKNIQSVYQQALSEAADFVVGPLSKQEVTTLAKADIHIPTLALNTLDNGNASNKSHLFQFALSPKDEVKQIADRAWQEGHRQAIFITSKDEWGQNLQRTFQTYWQSLGGTVIANLSFARNEKDFFNHVRELLVDKELAKAQELEAKQIKGKKQNRIPPARQDVDAIFLASLPNQARQIYPAVNFFYAGKIPVYATSSIYTGTPNTQGDQDLNGIHFIDMPWVLSGSQNKFYAFGMDAYRLINYLVHVENFPSNGIPAATGTLYLNSDHRIYRQLQWATIQNGRV